MLQVRPSPKRSFMISKTFQIIKAGQTLEKHQTGFTVPDLLLALKWKEDQRFYIQNMISVFVRKGRAVKLGSKKPIVYSFRIDVRHPTSGAMSPKTRREQSNRKNTDTPSWGVMHIQKLEQKLSEVEHELLENKRRLDRVEKAYAEQAATIETLNQAVAEQGKARKSITLRPAPVIQWKKNKAR